MNNSFTDGYYPICRDEFRRALREAMADLANKDPQAEASFRLRELEGLSRLEVMPLIDASSVYVVSRAVDRAKNFLKAQLAEFHS